MKYEDATKQGEDLKIERLDMANGGTATITVSTDWIGTVCAAIEKQIPKKARQPNPLTADVVIGNTVFKEGTSIITECPSCRKWVRKGDKYCSDCGQAISWESVKE